MLKRYILSRLGRQRKTRKKWITWLSWCSRTSRKRSIATYTFLVYFRKGHGIYSHCSLLFYFLQGIPGPPGVKGDKVKGLFQPFVQWTAKKISAPFMKISKNSCNYYPLIKYIKLEDPRSWVCARVLPSSVQTTKIIMSSIFTRAPGPPDAKQPKSINDSCIF